MSAIRPEVHSRHEQAFQEVGHKMEEAHESKHDLAGGRCLSKVDTRTLLVPLGIYGPQEWVLRP